MAGKQLIYKYPIRILLVEDNKDHARLMEHMFKKYDPKIEVLIAQSGIECLRILDDLSVHLIILDYELPMMSGLEVLSNIQSRKLNVPVIIVTGKGDETIAVQAMKKGVYEYIIKDKGFMYVLPRVALQTIDKHLLEKKMVESERKYQVLFDSIRDLISVQDEELNITLANKAAAEKNSLKVDDLIGQKCYHKFFNRSEPCENCPVLKTFETKRAHYLEMTYINEIYIIRSHPIFGLDNELENVIEIRQIITEQKHLENKIIQSEKLATIGLLSSGIAHELRNPLNIIETARYFIADMYSEQNPGLDEKLDIIKKNVLRASSIINNLLEFSRHSKNEKEAINMVEVIEKILSLVRKDLVAKDINLIKNYLQIPKVYFNLDSIKQVFLNLLINAIHAMPKGGKLTIATDNLDKDYCNVHIQDTGPGISDKDLPYIFSPFSIVKDVGMESGLGLYICHLIMEREGGKVSVQSKENIGSTFTISLPVYQS